MHITDIGALENVDEWRSTLIYLSERGPTSQSITSCQCNNSALRTSAGKSTQWNAEEHVVTQSVTASLPHNMASSYQARSLDCR